MLLDFIALNQYRSAPDGTDPAGKVVGLSKWGALLGLVTGGHDVMVRSHVETLPEVINCIAYWTVPLTAMAATFATTVFIATDLRKKDDKFNYVLGALATGGVFHAWNKKGFVSMYTTIAMMIAGCYYKHIEQTTKKFYANRPLAQPLPRDYKDYWTTVKDPRSTGWQPANRRLL